MLTAICPVPNGDHAGLNAVQDSTSQVGLLRPTPRLSDEGKARFFLAVRNGRYWPIVLQNSFLGCVQIFPGALVCALENYVGGHMNSLISNRLPL